MTPTQQCDGGNRHPALSIRLRTASHEIHSRAERSGIISQLLRGQASRRGYILYLRNLLPAYQALERELTLHQGTRAISRFFRPELARSAAMIRDLEHLHGQDWQEAVAQLPAATRYANRIAAASAAGPRLIGHAYTRQLADLSGARLLRGLLVRQLELADDEQAFFAFPSIGDPDKYKAGYRAALDAAGDEVPDSSAIVEEALCAFRCNIELAEAVQERAEA